MGEESTHQLRVRPGGEKTFSPPYYLIDESIIMKLAVIFFCAVAISVASADGSAPSEEFMEMDSTAMMESHPYPFASGNPQVLQNLVDLKAYCSVAYERADDLKSYNDGMAKSALIDLIIMFGKPLKKDHTKEKKAAFIKAFHDKHKFHPEKDQGAFFKKLAKIEKSAPVKYNMVTDYAKIIGKLTAKYFTGFGHYLITHLNKAVLFGRGVVSVRRMSFNGRNQAGFIGTILGFQHHPHYLDQISVLSSDFYASQADAIKMAKDADSQAASMWLIAGGKKKYRSFYGKIETKVKAKSEKLWKKVIHNALKGVKHAWKKHKKLHPQVPGGMLGAQEEFKRQAKKLKLPTNAQMVAAAKKLAEKWQKAHKKEASVVAKLIKKEETKVEKKVEKKEHAAKAAVKKAAAYKRAAKLMAQAGGKYT